MSDQNTEPVAQAASDPEPQAGTDQSQADIPKAQAANGSDSPDTTADDAAKARAEAAKYRRQLRDTEKRLAELEAADKARADADLSEAEKAARRATELEQELEQERAARRDSLLEAAVTAAAARLGFADARDAVALVSRTDLETTDDGRPDPQSVDSALKRLLTDRPHLRAGHTSGGSPTHSGRTDPPAETDQQRRARLFGGHHAGGMFDPAAAAKRGGGVVMPPT